MRFLSALLFCAALTCSGAWWDTDWDYRIPITIQSSEVPGDLTDFVIRVPVSSLPSAFISSLRSDGGDIRVLIDEDTTQVPFEISEFDQVGETGEIFYKATGTLSSSSNSTHYIYGGNATAVLLADTATYGRDNVWTENFQMVLHGDDTGTEIINSVGTGNLTGGTGLPNSAAGQLESSQDNPSTNEWYQEITGMTSFTPNEITISAYIYIDTAPGHWGTIISGYPSFRFGIRQTRRMFASFREDSQTTVTAYSDDQSWATNAEWHWVSVVKKTDGTITFYVENVAKGGGSTTNAQAYTELNFMRNDSTIGGFDYWHDGDIDELRVSKVARSTDWLTAAFNNLTDFSNFASVGAVQSQFAGSSPRIIIIH